MLCYVLFKFINNKYAAKKNGFPANPYVVLNYNNSFPNSFIWEIHLLYPENAWQADSANLSSLNIPNMADPLPDIEA